MEKKQDIVSIVFLFVVSIVGLALVPILVSQSNLEQFEFSARYSLVGALFTIICLLGITAVFYPTKCNGMFQKSQHPLSRANNPSNPMHIKGHHPNCQKYSGNRIRIGNKIFCAACSGLLIGSIIVLIGTISYFFVGLNVTWNSIWLIGLGEVWMLMGLAQIKFVGFVKMIINMIFVVGSFMMLVETDILSKSVLVDMYVLGLIMLLLSLRIWLSDWNNSRICQACQSCSQ